MDPFVMFITPEDGCGWVRTGHEETFSSSAPPEFNHVQFLADGAIAIAGAPGAAFTFGGLDLSEPGTDVTEAGDEVTLAAIERGGDVRWHKRIYHPGFDEVSAFLRSDDRLIVGMNFETFIGWSSGYTTPILSRLAAIAVFDAASGEERWMRDITNPKLQSWPILAVAEQPDRSLRIDANGRLLRAIVPARAVSEVSDSHHELRNWFVGVCGLGLCDVCLCTRIGS